MQKGHDLIDDPDVISEAHLHRWHHAQRLGNQREVMSK
jgi:hypothetical protein